MCSHVWNAICSFITFLLLQECKSLPWHFFLFSCFYFQVCSLSVKLKSFLIIDEKNMNTLHVRTRMFPLLSACVCACYLIFSLFLSGCFCEMERFLISYLSLCNMILILNFVKVIHFIFTWSKWNAFQCKAFTP